MQEWPKKFGRSTQRHPSLTFEPQAVCRWHSPLHRYTSNRRHINQITMMNDCGFCLVDLHWLSCKKQRLNTRVYIAQATVSSHPDLSSGNGTSKRHELKSMTMLCSGGRVGRTCQVQVQVDVACSSRSLATSTLTRTDLAEFPTTVTLIYLCHKPMKVHIMACAFLFWHTRRLRVLKRWNHACLRIRMTHGPAGDWHILQSADCTRVYDSKPLSGRKQRRRDLICSHPN